MNGRVQIPPNQSCPWVGLDRVTQNGPMDNSAPDMPDQTLSRRRPASRSSISTMTRRPTAPSWRACRSSSAILDSSSAPAHAHWPSASSSSSRPSRAEFRRYASPLVTSDVERDRSLKTETIHTHTHTFLKQETVSGSGISWFICKSAPRSRQITAPAPHHSVFYRPDALPAARQTESRH